MNTKNKKNKSTKNSKSVKRNVGRPAATINYPNRKFTFDELKAENTHVTPLCLRLTLKRDAALGKKSLIVKVKGELRENASGKGRKLEVYQKRSRIGIGSGKSSKSSAPVAQTVAVPAPVVTPTPVVAQTSINPELAPTPAPVTEAAPVVSNETAAPVADTAPVAN